MCVREHGVFLSAQPKTPDSLYTSISEKIYCFLLQSRCVATVWMFLNNRAA